MLAVMSDRYDAIVLISFGGPRMPDDVMPFLRNVTKGRGIPEERLAEVAEHYLHFDGASPINEQTEDLYEALVQGLANSGHPMPVYAGNRNWTPFIADAFVRAHADGHRRLLAVVTSPYACYSSCRQYLEDIERALAETRLDNVLAVDKVRQFFNHPGFIAPWVRGLEEAVVSLREETEDLKAEQIEVLFCAHSLPVGYESSSGPKDGRGVYVAQHLEVARLVLAEMAQRGGLELPNWQLVFQSRSGPPQMPWLVPDVNDAIAEIDTSSRKAVITVPISFLSDNMEVIWDLDNEAAATSRDLGFAFRRVPTPGTAPVFISALVEMIGERQGWVEGRCSVGKFDAWFDACPPGCCTPERTGSPRIVRVRTAGEESMTGASRVSASREAMN